MKPYLKLIHIRYPELWKWMSEIEWRYEIEELVGFQYSDAITLEDYVTENEHRHEEWIAKIKLKLL